jgi:ATP-dependent Lon protease
MELSIQNRFFKCSHSATRRTNSILQSAQANAGCRTVPNAKVANAKLEAAKSRFENLVEPIERLQTDLVLSGAMRPQGFRITPLLLLGEPGIGKTFLATQLADALGVSTEKMSAGGVQASFQLVGSHSGWSSARPGLFFSMLALGDSAAPVMVVDEVDKIYDDRLGTKSVSSACARRLQK